MPLPTSKVELQRFLGMITYLGKFIPNLPDKTAPLRKLLEKEILWHFDEMHVRAIKTLKEIITKEPILAYYDPQLPIRIIADASKTGLGAVLEQKDTEEWKPVGYASRAMREPI